MREDAVIDDAAVVARLRSAGCVFAEDEAALLLSAARSNPVGSVEGARRVAAVTHGDLREAALKAMLPTMKSKFRLIALPANRTVTVTPPARPGPGPVVPSHAPPSSPL